MSKDDRESGKILITPHIEIGRGTDPNHRMVHVNVDTFRHCLGELTFSRSEKGSQHPEVSFILSME